MIDYSTWTTESLKLEGLDYYYAADQLSLKRAHLLSNLTKVGEFRNRARCIVDELVKRKVMTQFNLKDDDEDHPGNHFTYKDIEF